MDAFEGMVQYLVMSSSVRRRRIQLCEVYVCLRLKYMLCKMPYFRACNSTRPWEKLHLLVLRWSIHPKSPGWG